MLVRQTDVQRRGGACAKYPTSCVVRMLLDRAGLLRPFHSLRVIDVTFGAGVFWYALRSKAVVVGVDIRRVSWVARPRCFFEARAEEWPVWLPRAVVCLDGVVDVVVVDPPWARKKHRTRGHFLSPGVGAERAILEAAVSLARALDVPLLVHYREPVEGGRVLAEAWFQGRSRYAREPKPSWFGVLAV